MDIHEQTEVRHSVQEAIALFQEAGKEEALARIGDRNGPFTKDTHYIFALDLDGNLLAHPYLKDRVGQSLAELKDSEGRAFIRLLVNVAKRRGHGYTYYNWIAQGSQEELKKTTFFQRVGDVILCSGFYSPKEDPIARFSLQEAVV